jgi:carbon monoxide dehydrogenase subunit G
MRILFLQLLLTSAAVLAAAADKGTFSGKWQVLQNIAGNENSQTCTFTQNGNDLSGSCGSEQNALQISGKVDDTKVTWSYKTEYNGSPLESTGAA